MVISFRKNGFTVIELSVAAAVLAILATLVMINLAQTRRAARDSIRKSDAPALLTAVNQFALANGTSFLRDTDSSSRQLKSCALDVSNDPGIAGIGDGCVGASGRAYGLVNAAGNLILTGQGSAASQDRRYTNVSMVEALRNGGYLNTDPKDPLNGVGKLTSSNDVDRYPDYALIRSCPNGEQHVGSRGQLFAIWVLLERPLSREDREAQRNTPGSIYAGPVQEDGFYYAYDFAAGTSYQTRFEENGFGVGNGSTRKDVALETCADVPAAS